MGLLCVTRYVLCSMCYVLRGSVVRDAWRVVVRLHVLLRPLNWPLSNLPGRVFDGVSCTHRTYYFDYSSNTHLRYDNPAKCPRAVVPFFLFL